MRAQPGSLLQYHGSRHGFHIHGNAVAVNKKHEKRERESHKQDGAIAKDLNGFLFKETQEAAG